MENHRQTQLLRQGQLAAQNPLLHGAGREIVMVIQADFSDGSHLGLPGKFADLCFHLRRIAAGVVGMHPHGRIYGGIFRRQLGRRRDIRRAGGAFDHRQNPFMRKRGDHLASVFVKSLV